MMPRYFAPSLTFIAVVMLFPLFFCGPAQAGPHCGAAGDWRSNLVPDRWPPPGFSLSGLPGGIRTKAVPIYKACIRHDRCYDRRGSSRAACDRRFLRDMVAECNRVYRDILDLPLRTACRAAARGYFRAVVKYGGPAFARAQGGRQTAGAVARQPVAGTSPEQAGTVPGRAEQTRPEQARSRTPEPAPAASRPQKAPPRRPKWTAWGKLIGVTQVAAMHGTLYAYKAASKEVFASPITHCSWERLGAAPAGRCFAGGQGYLYMSGVAGREMWIMRPHSKPWHKLGETQPLAALAAGGNKLFCWSSSGQALRMGHPRRLEWRDLERLTGVVSLAVDTVRLYCLRNPGLKIMWRRRGRSQWRDLGTAPVAGSLAANQGKIFLAVRQTGWILRAPAR